MTSSESWPCAAIPRAELAPRTTMRVGGRVEWLLEPATPDELVQAWLAALEHGGPIRILGGGANLVVDDGVLPGVVIATDRLRRIFRPPPETAPEEELDGTGAGNVPTPAVAHADPALDPRLIVWAGASLPALLRAARDLGYSGLEGLAGVPGNAGGGIAMNAGGRWGDMWDVVERVRVLEPSGEVSDLDRSDFNPTYRNGGLESRVAVAAILRFEPRRVPEIQERMREYLTIKNRVQPVSEWSSGCIFRNPDPEHSEGRSAGQLVEECGAKELRRGGAIVSPLHGNFIVNTGDATATDVFALMADVRERVSERSGIRLEFEVKRWREPDEGC